MRVLISALLLAQAIAAGPALADSDMPLSVLGRANQQSIQNLTAEQGPDVATPPERQLDAGKTADLEHAFWICDYAQTKGTLEPDQEALCSAITDELRRVKFGGDFERLLAWWQLHKIAQHQELDRALAAAIATEQQARSAI